MMDWFVSDYLYGSLFGIGLILVTFLTGRYVERKHLLSLEEREISLGHIVTTNLKRYPVERNITSAQFVHGQATVGSDHFKTTMSRIRKIFGGRMRSIEHIMTRCRREALIRLLEEADVIGATHVLNVRYETSSISPDAMITAEVHAYGTAIVVGPSER